MNEMTRTDTPQATGAPDMTCYFHEATFTAVYLVADPATGTAVIIDPALDFDPASGRTATTSVDGVIKDAEARGLKIEWVLETHVHADHLTAAAYLRDKLGVKIAIGENVTRVQKVFADLFNLKDVTTDGSQFDRLLKDGDEIAIGQLTAKVIHTPGHTPACVSYVIGDAVFVGDTIFMPDFGSARCDFPGGDAKTLFASVGKLLDLPPATRMFVGHDYAPGGRDYAWETTVAAQKAENIHMKDGTDEAAFVEMRTSRDAQLSAPKLILPSLQVNIRAGALPPAEDNGVAYLKIPLDAF